MKLRSKSQPSKCHVHRGSSCILASVASAHPHDAHTFFMSEMSFILQDNATTTMISSADTLLIQPSSRWLNGLKMSQLKRHIILLKCLAWRQQADGLVKSSGGFRTLATQTIAMDPLSLQSCELKNLVSKCLVQTFGAWLSLMICKAVWLSMWISVSPSCGNQVL